MKQLYENGAVLTMKSPVPCQALLVEDGRIAAVGERAEVLPFADDAERIDLAGGALLPGFMDGHSHFSQVASSLLQVSLNGADTPEEMRRRISAYIKENNLPEGSWVTAREYDHNLLPDAAHLPAAVIDTLAPGYKLLIAHTSGHVGLANREALTSLGITAATQAPAGGRIGVQDGKLTGYLEENAFFAYQKQVPMPDSQQLMAAFARAQAMYASYGITTMQEGMVVEQMLPLYKDILASGLLKGDLVAYPDRQTVFDMLAQFPHSRGRYDRHLKIGGMKIFLDGSPQGRTAWMRAPYAGEKEYRGYGTLTDEQVLEAMETAAKNNMQVLAHCNGDAAVAQYLACAAQCEKLHPSSVNNRNVVIHAQLMGLDQLMLAARLNMIASFFVAHTYYWGDVHLKNFGAERANDISPAASAIQAGLCYTFHQDAPVIAPNMLETVWCAATRRTKAGVVLGEKERISVYDALKGVTVNAAYQYFEENEKGVLAPGYRADLVLLDKNPLTVPVEELREIRVKATIKDGQRIFCT